MSEIHWIERLRHASHMNFGDSGELGMLRAEPEQTAGHKESEAHSGSLEAMEGEGSMQSRTWPSLLSRTAGDRLLSGGEQVRAKEAEVMGSAQGAEIPGVH